jgi:hypothetical protein
MFFQHSLSHQKNSSLNDASVIPITLAVDGPAKDAVSIFHLSLDNGAVKC